MKDETVLFNPSNNKFCVLNATAAYIWQSLARPQSAHELALAITGNFANVGLEQAEQDVQRALAELQRVECIVYPE